MSSKNNHRRNSRRDCEEGQRNKRPEDRRPRQHLRQQIEVDLMAFSGVDSREIVN